jgi:hypothetical protein
MAFAVGQSQFAYYCITLALMDAFPSWVGRRELAAVRLQAVACGLLSRRWVQEIRQQLRDRERINARLDAWVRQREAAVVLSLRRHRAASLRAGKQGDRSE